MNQTNPPTPSYNFAKDGFLYLVSYFTLFICAVSLNFLAKELVNTVIGDSADIYGFWGGSMMSGLLASLMIGFPVFIAVNFYANKELGSGRMKHDTGVRRWLIYLTLVAVVLTIIGQLITLLTTYFGGFAGERFVIHTLITLAIAGAIFWYEWWHLRWFDGTVKTEVQSSFKIFEWAVIATVVGVMVWGFTSSGGPMYRRAHNLDDIRLSRIASIRTGIDNFYGRKGVEGFSDGELRLPKSLDELRKHDGIYLSEEDIKDPVAGKSIEYKPGNGKQYQLCAEFATVFDKNTKNPSNPYRAEDYYHPKGNHCFDLVVSTNN